MDLSYLKEQQLGFPRRLSPWILISSTTQRPSTHSGLSNSEMVLSLTPLASNMLPAPWPVWLLATVDTLVPVDSSLRMRLKWSWPIYYWITISNSLRAGLKDQRVYHLRPNISLILRLKFCWGKDRARLETQVLAQQ